MTQLDFTLPPRSRNTDPVTSRLAGEDAIRSGRVAEQHAMVLAAVRANPGWTALEHDRHHGTDRVFGRRLKELEARGLVRRGHKRECREGRRLAITWWAV